MKPLIVFFLSIFLLSACRKYDTEVIGKGNTLAEGVVLDATTNKPVPNATVLLQAQNRELAWGGYGTIKQYTADEEGRFAFRFESDEKYSYFIDAYKGDYYFGAEHSKGIDAKKKNEGLKINIRPAAFIAFHVMEVDSIEGRYLSINNSLCSNGQEFNTIGINATTICKYFGNKEIDVIWGTIVNGEQKKGGGIYRLTPLDTTLVDIYF